MQAPTFQEEVIATINDWRQTLYKKRLIGSYPDGIGYGNLSCRTLGTTFLITGSGTGNLPVTHGGHYSMVHRYHFEENWVECSGPVKASSETMSHAALYEAQAAIQVIFHIHHLSLWKNLMERLPSTAASVPYGTPEMTREISSLLQHSVIQKERIFAMGGHREGIIAFGESFERAWEPIEKHLSILD